MSIKKYRERTGLSRQVAATQLGISISTLARWEENNSFPLAFTSKIQSLYALSDNELLRLIKDTA